LLFMIPADSPDHAKEFDILYNELEQYNPELLQKRMLLAITKSDMLDDELKAAISGTLPKDVPHIFIASVSGEGIVELKDMLWRALTEE
jgi:GTP-binding protein